MKNRPGLLTRGVYFILSGFAWVFVSLLTILFFMFGFIFVVPVALIFDPTKSWMHGIAAAWARCVLAIIPVWKLRLEGQQNINPKKNYVVVANHQSMLDIFVLLAALNVHFKFIAKKELFAIPFIGWHMLMSGYIPVNRGNRESAQDAIFKARDYMKRGVSVLFFPEGTRSVDGEIKAFKRGAFRLALDEGIEVLPVVIEGTGQAVPKHSWVIKDETCFVLSVGRPVRLTRENTFEKTCEQVHQEMKDRLARIRADRRDA